MARNNLFSCFPLICNNRKLIFTNRFSCINVPFMGLKDEAKNAEINFPQKPKRPLTAYFRFLTEQRPKVLQANPCLKPPEVVKKISDEWRKLSEAAKLKYQEQADKEKEVYSRELETYTSQLSLEQEETLREIKSQKRKYKEKLKLKKEIKAAGKPKKPVSIFGLFVKEYSDPQKTLSENIKELKSKWAHLSEAEKQKYQNQYQKLKAYFDIEMARWEAEMVAEGKSHLIRAKTLKESARPKKDGLKDDPQ